MPEECHQLLSMLGQPAASAQRFQGAVFRSCSPRYATDRDLLSGLGSRKHGGRWNQPGTSMVYASLSPEVAMAEALAHFRYYGVPIEDAMPRVFVAIDVQLCLVLDLRIESLRAKSEECLVACLGDWRRAIAAGKAPVSQRLGQAAAQGGWEGLVVPSAASAQGFNILILPDNLQQGSHLVVRSSFHAAST